MQAYEHILVVIDEQNFVTKAISKAVNLIDRTHGQISLSLLESPSVINRIFPFLNTEHMHKTEALIEEKTAKLQLLIKELSAKGVAINPELFTCKSHSNILTLVNEKNIDTVFIAASNHNLVKGYHPRDVISYLIGQCHAPLFIVTDHKWAPSGHILSAVELCTEKPEHQMLTKKVLEESEHLTQLLNGDCHTVDCYFGESIDMSFKITNTERNQDIHLSLMKKHCHDYHLPYENVHLSLELPERAIEHLSKEIDSELIILGDCGHRGLLSTLSTHVSEEVLNHVNCDLLVLKP
ncbi:MAG: universal stress protein [Colwellia sp.]|nr:universal stress protein [Colwellia sp.]MCW8864083.1 universal stress protein [Colwellia sp.]MCW9080592.1 universal stress protein [Colwellia sp.]